MPDPKYTVGESACPTTGRHAGKDGTVSAEATSDGWVKVSFADGFGRYPAHELEPVPELPQRVRGATLAPSYVEAGVESVPESVVEEFTCPVAGCDYVTGAVGPVAPGEVDEFAADVFEHQASHPVSGTPRDIGEWNTTAGDVIVFRTSDGVLHADVLADSSVKEPAHLRRLAEALNAAAVAWEAVL